MVNGFRNTLKMAEIGGVFYYTSTTSGYMANWRSSFDSAYQIGLYIPPKLRTNCSWRWLVSGYKKRSKIAEIGADLGHSVTTSGDMANPRAPVDSAYQIGLYIPPKTAY